MHAVRRRLAARLTSRWLPPLAMLLLLNLSGLAFAHGGEDHGDAIAAASLHAAPRVVAQTDRYELVGILKAERLVIFLDRFADNAPVTDAVITVGVNGKDTLAQREADGTYRLVSDAFAGTDAVDLLFNVSAPSGDDLLIGSLKLTPTFEGAATSASTTPPVSMLRRLATERGSPVFLTLAALLLGICLGLFARGLKLLSLATAIGVVTLLAFSGVLFAHEGHDDAPAPSVAADAPQRLPDGSVVVPKPSQRILNVRTELAKATTAQKAESWVGRVISDPNRSGLVQSINGGRVIAPETGLPRLGQAVRKGDLLAMIEGPMIPSDRATISEKLGDIEQQTALAQAKLARARQLLLTNSGPRIAVTDAEIELEGLKRRAEIVRGIRGTPEQLRAPVDGVIATARVVAGQVVQAQDVLFQVIDPQSLWVEALVYSDASPTRIDGATGLATDGTKLKLAFQGVGRALQQQASVVHFSIVDPPAALSVGQPVTVMAPAGEARTGIIVPRDAVVKGGNGELLVWRHGEPERFEPLPVRAEPFDAAHFVIRAGVKDGERIVVHGAELINQVR
jgi:membrane fusion protein, heavy metal efflux system